MNRFAVDTDLDRSAPIWIATLLAIIYSTIALVARVFFKAASVGTEDAIIVGAQVVAFGQFGATIHALRQGVGLTDMSLLGAGASSAVVGSFKASQILYLVASTLAKLSMVFLINRIFSHLDSRRAAVLCIALGGVVAAWGITSTLATSIGCQPVHVMQSDTADTCPGGGARWLAVLLFECVLEGAIVVLPTIFCSKLQMSLDKKIKVVVAFAFRLLIIFFSAMHYGAYSEVVSTDSNAYLSSVLIWQQAGLCYSLVSATIPVSLQFIGKFATGVSVALSNSQARSRGTQGSRQYGALSTRLKSKTSATRSEDQEALTVRPDPVGNFTSAYRVPEGRQMSQEGIMRQDSITLTYSHQPGQAY